jgi:hypothetical protein
VNNIGSDIRPVAAERASLQQKLTSGKLREPPGGNVENSLLRDLGVVHSNVVRFGLGRGTDGGA